MTPDGRAHLEFDDLLQHLAAVGFAALLTWIAVGGIGLYSGYLQIDTHQVLKFLLAVLILVFARRTFWELRQWRWKRVPAEARYGFADPLRETPRGNEHPSEAAGPAQAGEAATDPQHPAQ
jgi:hypothetical protein